MKMKKQFCCLNYGSKGFVFTIDMIVAMVFAVLILVIANYSVRTGESSFSKLQIEKTGSDIAALLDHKGILDSLNNEIILNDLNDLLPINYDMHINISTFNDVTLTIGNSLPNDKFIISGKRVFVVSTLNELTQELEITDYGKLQYWIWLK